VTTEQVGRKTRTRTIWVDQFGIPHDPSTQDYLPLDYRVRVDAHQRAAGRITFPLWAPLTRCGWPANGRWPDPITPNEF
jgi:hypothetical protein